MKIKNEKQYTDTINSINDIMKKGENNVTPEELQALQDKTAQVQEYESRYYTFPAPKTIIDMVKVKMFERDMSQTDLAKETNIPLPKINQILKGKRKPDIDFLKGIYDKLHIPADFILSRI
ncbi:helix-turn-helix domain-containing protein [Albibacterium indicum]|uniref:helix-turn-helix domain-containing protein n=1 Tax=Albibacterium indicum TaxID=2292082 RepID=UPI000E504A83|nr:helix-turn-helix domain-containing protein [Pedobacter indicus]